MMHKIPNCANVIAQLFRKRQGFTHVSSRTNFYARRTGMWGWSYCPTSERQKEIILVLAWVAIALDTRQLRQIYCRVSHE